MVYRSADDALRRRRDELILERQVEVQALPDAVASVYVRRRARADAGVAGIVVVAAMVLAAALQLGGLTGLLELSWVVMAAVYVLSRVAGRRRVDATFARVYAATDDPAGDVRRLTDLRPERVLAELADGVEWRSVAMPMTALAMVLPLTLHLVFVTVLRMGPPDRPSFDAWIGLSLLCVGHCHVVLTSHVFRFAERVRATDDAVSVGLIADRAGWRAWGLTIASSVIAGLLLLLVLPLADVALPAVVLPLAVSALAVIAPALVAVTGLAFIPAMFGLMGKRLREERLLLAYPAYCRGA